VLTSFGISVLFLLRNLIPSMAVPEVNKTAGYTLLGCMVAVHGGVALLMKFYFFTY